MKLYMTVHTHIVWSNADQFKYISNLNVTFDQTTATQTNILTYSEKMIIQIFIGVTVAVLM